MLDDDEPYEANPNYWRWKELECGLWVKIPRWKGDKSRFYRQTGIRYDDVVDFTAKLGGLIMDISIGDGTIKMLSGAKAFKFLYAMQDYLGIRGDKWINQAMATDSSGGSATISRP